MDRTPPLVGDARQRDLLPLPFVEEPPAPARHLSRPVKQRVLRRRAAAVRCNQSIETLNSLYCSSDERVQVRQSSIEASASLLARFNSFSLDGHASNAEEAVRSLLGDNLAYSGEFGKSPTALASYEQRRVSLPRSLGPLTQAVDVLDPEASSTLQKFRKEMMHDENSYARRIESEGKILSYTDPKLRNKSEYLGFIRMLYDESLISFTTTPREFSGIFFVKKKDGDQRFICDCRAANQRFLRCPAMPIGGSASWSALRADPDRPFYTAQFDIRSYFFRIGIPLELGEYFSFRQVPSSFVRDLVGSSYNDLLGRQSCVPPSQLDVKNAELDDVAWFPFMKVLPMGFSWAMWFAQRLHVQLSIESSGVPRDRFFLDGRPAPDLRAGTCLMPYADNANIVGHCPHDVRQVRDRIIAKFRSLHFEVHEITEPQLVTESLGVLVDGAKHEVRPTRRRVTKCILAMEYIARRPLLSGAQLEHCVGHLTFLMLLDRKFLCLLNAMYSFIRRHYRMPVKIWRSVATEAWRIRCLLPLLYTDVSRPVSEIIYAGDSCTGEGDSDQHGGYSLCTTRIPQQAAFDLSVWQERMRYKQNPLVRSVKPRSQALDLKAFEHGPVGALESTVHSGDLLSPANEVQPIPSLEKIMDFPEVGLDVISHEWHSIFAGSWTFREPIHVTEARCVVLAARHAMRSVHNMRKTHIILSDNFAVSLVMSKGRACNHALLVQCRRLLSLAVAGSSSFVVRWVPSEYNPSDAGSRDPHACPEKIVAELVGGNMLQWRGSGRLRRWRDENIDKKADDSRAKDPGETSSALAPISIDKGIEMCPSPNEPFSARSVFDSPSSRSYFTVSDGRSSSPSSWGETIEGTGQGWRKDAQERSTNLPGDTRGGRCDEAELPHDPRVLLGLRRKAGPRYYSTTLRPCGRGSAGSGGSGVVRSGVFRGPSRKSGYHPLGSARRSLARGESVGTHIPAKVSSSEAGVEETGSWSYQRSSSSLAPRTSRVGFDQAPPFRDRCLASSDVHGLPQAQRGPITQGRRRHSTVLCLQVLLGDAPPRGGFGGEQDWAVLRWDRAGLSRIPVVGAPPGLDGPSVPICLSSSLQHWVSRTPERVPDVNAQLPNPGPISLSHQARGCFSRPCQRPENNLFGEAPRSLGDGCGDEKIRERSEAPEDRARYPHCDVGKGPRGARPSAGKPRDHRPRQVRRALFGKYFLELFAGSASLSKALKQHGIRSIAYDVRYGRSADLLNPHVIWKVYSMVNSKHCLGVWFGCPVSTLSRAPRSDDSGPTPLRGDTEKLRWGLPGLKGENRERVETANRLIRMILRLCRHCLRIGVPFYLENPLNSRLWDFRSIKALAASPFVTASRYDFCQFGTPWRKATKLLCFDNPHIERGAKQCKFDRAHICSATGKKHVVLSGVSAHYRHLTSRAASYPREFCHVIAKAIREEAVDRYLFRDSKASTLMAVGSGGRFTERPAFTSPGNGS